MLFRRNTHLTTPYKWLGLVFLLFIIPACSNDNPDSTTEKLLQRVPLASLQLQQVNDCAELKNYVSTSLIKRYTTIPSYGYYSCPSNRDGVDGGAPEIAVPGAGDGANLSNDDSSPEIPTPNDVSDTNNQVSGVHEGDIIKTDSLGNMYILSGRHFMVAKGFPPQDLTTLTKIDLGAHGLNLFLDKENHRVTILARHDAPIYIAETRPSPAEDALSVVYPTPEQDYTVAIFYDVTNPSEPKVIDQIRMRGYFREGRRIENRLHLVSSHYLQLTALNKDTGFIDLRDKFSAIVNKAKCDSPNGDINNNPDVILAKKNLSEKITGIIDTIDPSTYLPDANRITDGTLEPIPYLACNDINHPAVNMSLGLQIITSIDTDGANMAGTGVINNSHITYASKNSLYLAENSQNWWWVLPNNERPTSQSVIYKFAISKDAPSYVATGRVDGYIHNQFSMSEQTYDGKDVLRVATTQDDFFRIDDSDPNSWQRVQTNHLSLLGDDEAGQLNLVGEVRNFAPNENIRSARFIGNRGFVVTFRNVDPLFTFDLSNPVSPELMGELTIPGFSSYMHPYDDRHLITIGREGGLDGIGTGNDMQLQLVDVSDMSAPKVIHKYTPDVPQSWSWSAAEYDHKAFTFYKPANLLAIPLQISPTVTDKNFSGVEAYEITLASGFKPLGRVDHSDLAFDYYCQNNPPLRNDFADHCNNGLYFRWAAPRRSVVMTDTSDVYLYTISDVGLKASSTKDLPTTLGSLIFPPQPYPWRYYGYNPGGGIADPIIGDTIDILNN